MFHIELDQKRSSAVLDDNNYEIVKWQVWKKKSAATLNLLPISTPQASFSLCHQINVLSDRIAREELQSK